MILEPLKANAFEVNMFAQHTFAHRLPMVYSSHNSNLINLYSMKQASFNVLKVHKFSMIQ